MVQCTVCHSLYLAAAAEASTGESREICTEAYPDFLKLPSCL